MMVISLVFNILRSVTRLHFIDLLCPLGESACRLFNQIMNEFEAPPIDPAINEEFLEFAKLRKSEGCCQLTFKVTV